MPPAEKHYWKLTYELIFQELPGSHLKPLPFNPDSTINALFHPLPHGPALSQANPKHASLCSWALPTPSLIQGPPEGPPAHRTVSLPQNPLFCAQPSVSYHH